MTERFIVDDDGIVTDMLDLSMYIDEEDCCEKLNELHDENKQLHRVIEENEKMIQSIGEELLKLRIIKKNLREIKTKWNWIMESVDYD